MHLRLSHALLHWLGNVPIADPIDRRNAVAMQSLFLFMGITVPLAWLHFLAVSGMPKTGVRGIAGAMIGSTITLFCVWMIRRGWFRHAVTLNLITGLVTLGVDYASVGFVRDASYQFSSYMTLIVASLVLGHRAVWLAFAALQLLTALGVSVDIARNATPLGQVSGAVLSTVVTQLIITVIVDWSSSSLRRSLTESDRMRHDLQREMAERERVQTQLVHAQKMEATGRLAGGIAHDFNNILDLVLGYARKRVRLKKLESPDARAAALDAALNDVETVAKHGVALTRKLLAFSRSDVLRIEVFDAGVALAEVQPILRQLFPPSVRLELEATRDPAPVRLDRSEFELMVLNIAANARDAMSEGGEFTVALRASSEWAEIVLSDTGHGMDEKTRLRIFDPFFSTKQAGVGTGLGLSIVGDLVKVAGGDIVVESRPDAGTTFRIRIPLAEPTPPP